MTHRELVKALKAAGLIRLVSCTASGCEKHYDSCAFHPGWTVVVRHRDGQVHSLKELYDADPGSTATWVAIARNGSIECCHDPEQKCPIDVDAITYTEAIAQDADWLYVFDGNGNVHKFLRNILNYVPGMLVIPIIEYPYDTNDENEVKRQAKFKSAPLTMK